jgi:polysaccharide biosynthesis/export protein
MKRNILFKFSFFILITVLFATACVPQKNLRYLQDTNPDTIVKQLVVKPFEYHLQPGDFLYIKINSLDKKTNDLFNDITGNYNGGQGIQNFYLSSYMVNDTGYLYFPVIGQIKAAGKTVGEVQKDISAVISNYVNQSDVIVKQVNFLVTILGEVRQPQQINVQNNKINILEAIAKAGDLNPFANRKDVKIIRHHFDKTEVISIDLTKKNLLASPDYYLQPNDIVYVEPLKGKQYTFETFPYATILSILSTVLVISTYFKK